MPGTPRSTSASCVVVVEQQRRVKLASCSARNTRHSLPGCCSRAATTARQAREVALTRSFGAGANGIP